MLMGWVKLHREILEKAIWKCSTAEQKAILITLILLANHKENQWIWKGEKFKCSPGQFITSLKSIADKAEVSIKNVRTALLKFEKLEFLANETASNGRLITILNWDIYQNNEQEGGKLSGKQVAKGGQRAGKRVATIKNIKEREELFKSKVREFKNHPASMLEEFIDYWTEPNKSGTKMLWEMKQTWDLKRRLSRWASRAPLKEPKSRKQPDEQRTGVTMTQTAILEYYKEHGKYPNQQ